MKEIQRFKHVLFNFFSKSFFLNPVNIQLDQLIFGVCVAEDGVFQPVPQEDWPGRGIERALPLPPWQHRLWHADSRDIQLSLH